MQLAGAGVKQNVASTGILLALRNLEVEHVGSTDALVYWAMGCLRRQPCFDAVWEKTSTDV